MQFERSPPSPPGEGATSRVVTVPISGAPKHPLSHASPIYGQLISLSWGVGRGEGEFLRRFPVIAFDYLPEIVLADIDDSHFALGVFFRIAGMRGVDHHRLAKF